MTELILGIDDAGRGPVIGPMVLAGCLVGHESDEEIRDSGVKDSKLLTSSRRDELYDKIRKMSKDYFFVVFTALEINDMMDNGINLNHIEAIAAAQIINKIRIGRKDSIKVILDCPSINTSSWLAKVKTLVGNLHGLTFICEHKADANYPAVSAASIIAKVTRDREIEKLKKDLGVDFGSGYPSDPFTVDFIKKNFNEYRSKGIFREHWQTLKNITGIDTKKESKSKIKEMQKKLF